MNTDLIPANETVGDRLRKVRGTMSQEAFAQLLTIGRTTLIRYEKGERSPDADLIAKLLVIFKVDALWLLTGKREPTPALPFSGQIDPYPQSPFIQAPAIDPTDQVEQRLRYALYTLTADMAQGFTLVTGYGAIQVAAADAEGFQRLARRMLITALADHLATKKGQVDGA